MAEPADAPEIPEPEATFVRLAELGARPETLGRLRDLVARFPGEVRFRRREDDLQGRTLALRGSLAAGEGRERRKFGAATTFRTDDPDEVDWFVARFAQALGGAAQDAAAEFRAAIARRPDTFGDAWG